MTEPPKYGALSAGRFTPIFTRFRVRTTRFRVQPTRFHVLRTRFVLTAAIVGSAAFLPGTALAEPQQGLYIGAFGGTGASVATSLRQRGKVYINDRLHLPIDAQGSTQSSTRVGLGGLQLGYEWGTWRSQGANWGVSPAAELEGIYIGKHTPEGVMPVTPRALGTQYVEVPTSLGLLMANAVFTFRTPYSDNIFPYLGVGAGVARVTIKGSDSANPMEPGINHFNSDPNASDTALAMQLKAGFKAEINRNLSIFTEYRYLTVDSTRYTFGATDYPGLHLPTDTWRVDMGKQKYNLFVAGLQYKF